MRNNSHLKTFKKPFFQTERKIFGTALFGKKRLVKLPRQIEYIHSGVALRAK